MESKNYNTKWAITYKGKSYLTIYGKKKAYSLLVRLSSCLVGIAVMQVAKREYKKITCSKAKIEYYRHWRVKNKHKVKEYNRRNYLKRKGVIDIPSP